MRGTWPQKLTNRAVGAVPTCPGLRVLNVTWFPEGGSPIETCIEHPDGWLTQVPGPSPGPHSVGWVACGSAFLDHTLRAPAIDDEEMLRFLT